MTKDLTDLVRTIQRIHDVAVMRVALPRAKVRIHDKAIFDLAIVRHFLDGFIAHAPDAWLDLYVGICPHPSNTSKACEEAVMRLSCCQEQLKLILVLTFDGCTWHDYVMNDQGEHIEHPPWIPSAHQLLTADF
jgi:hypothetical protein